MNEFNSTVRIDNSVITLADQPVVELQLSHPANFEVDPVQLKEQLLLTGHALAPPFVIVDQQVNIDTNQTSLRYTLEPELIGEHLLSFGVVTFKNGNQAHSLIPEVLSLRIIQPEELTLRADSLIPMSPRPVAELSGTNKQHLAEDAQLQPGINRTVLYEHTFPWHYIAGYCSFGILFFLVGRLVLRYWQRNRPKLSPPDPKQVALQSLQSLKKEDLSFDPFYTRLTHLLRNYFEQAHNIPATEMTSEEFLSSLSDNQTLPATARTQLKELLTHADRVKFAMSASTEERKDKALRLAHSLLKQK